MKFLHQNDQSILKKGSGTDRRTYMYMYVTVPALYYVNSVSFEFSLFNKKK